MLSPKILKVIPLDEYKLKLTFETGEVKVFNVKPYISGSWFEELLNPVYFKSVHTINNGYSIEWANGQDIAPHELYEFSVAFNQS